MLKYSYLKINFTFIFALNCFLSQKYSMCWHGNDITEYRKHSAIIMYDRFCLNNLFFKSTPPLKFRKIKKKFYSTKIMITGV